MVQNPIAGFKLAPPPSCSKEIDRLRTEMPPVIVLVRILLLPKIKSPRANFIFGAEPIKGGLIT